MKRDKQRIGFSRKAIIIHWSGVIVSLGLGLFFWFGFLAKISENLDPLWFWLLTFWWYFWVSVSAVFSIRRLAFIYSVSSAIIITDKGITDQTTRNRFSFFIPWEDILSVKWDWVGDFRTGLPSRRGGRSAQYHIYLLLRAKEKYTSTDNKAIKDSKEGPIYDIPCLQLDITFTDLRHIFEERIVMHKKRDKGEAEYLSKLHRLQSKGA